MTNGVAASCALGRGWSGCIFSLMNADMDAVVVVVVVVAVVVHARQLVVISPPDRALFVRAHARSERVHEEAREWFCS